MDTIRWRSLPDDVSDHLHVDQLGSHLSTLFSSPSDNTSLRQRWELARLVLSALLALVLRQALR